MWETIKWLMSQLWVAGKLDLSDEVWERLVKEMNNKRPNRSVIDIYTQKMFRGGQVSFEEFEFLYNMGDNFFGESRISIMRKFKKSYSKLEFRDGQFEIKPPQISIGTQIFIFILLTSTLSFFIYIYWPELFSGLYNSIPSSFRILLFFCFCCFWLILDEFSLRKNAKEIIFRQKLYLRRKNKRNSAKPMNNEGFEGLFFVLGCLFFVRFCSKNFFRNYSHKK